MTLINEKSTATYKCALYDPAKVQVPKNQITGLQLTLIDKRTRAFINGREDQNVLDLNGVNIALDGTVTWEMSAQDNVIVNDEYSQEDHVAIFLFILSGGQHHHTVIFTVKNLVTVV
jgi:hypothetical protein